MQPRNRIPVLGRAEFVRKREEIRARLPLHEVIGQVASARLIRTHDGYRSLCPFHREKTPSFRIRSSTQTYKCFGIGCDARGDVFDFLAAWYETGYREAFLRAAVMADVDLTPSCTDNPGMRGRRCRKDSSARSASLVLSSDLPPAAGRNKDQFPRAKPLEPMDARSLIPVAGRRAGIMDSARSRRYAVLPSMVHVYRDREGLPLLYLLRVEDRAGGSKFFLPLREPQRTKAGTVAWHLLRLTPATPRPFYGIEKINEWRTVGGNRLLVVEGEKTRDAAQALLPLASTGILVLCSLGGGSAVRLADWAPVLEVIGNAPTCIDGIHVLVWPDADRDLHRRDGTIVDRREKFVREHDETLRAIAHSLDMDLNHVRISKIIPPAGVKPGWDLADALEEGWTTEDVLDHMDRNTVAPGAGKSAPAQGKSAKRRVMVRPEQASGEPRDSGFSKGA